MCAADSCEWCPAQQVAHEYRALDMANAEQLRVLFDEIQPDIIVPEVEASHQRIGCRGRAWRTGGAKCRKSHPFAWIVNVCAYLRMRNADHAVLLQASA